MFFGCQSWRKSMGMLLQTLELNNKQFEFWEQQIGNVSLRGNKMKISTSDEVFQFFKFWAVIILLISSKIWWDAHSVAKTSLGSSTRAKCKMCQSGAQNIIKFTCHWYCSWLFNISLHNEKLCIILCCDYLVKA